MRVGLEKYKVNALTALRIVGYRKKSSRGDYIREDRDGRFHAYIEDSKGINLHYDLFTDRTRTIHFAPYVPIRMSKEIKRILGTLKSIGLRKNM